MWNKLTNHVFYTNNDPETDRPCIGYVQGEKAGLLMDAGNSLAHAELLKKGLAEKGLPEPNYIALTHAHWDHTYGLCGWKGVSFAGKKTNAILGKMQAWQWDDASMKKRIENGEDSEFCFIHIRKEYPDRSLISVKPADISLQGELEIDLGGVMVVLKEVTSPHAADCVVFSVPEDGLLFLGDSYCSVPVGDDWVYDKDLLGKYIDWLEGEDFVVAIKGHHPPQTKAELLAELKADYAAL
ncbi:MAG: MBL fold metallo-hydrolase [Anaerotignum sp.]|nr:MBL fold metallo-hydrolase [Anaerotignum sp.]